MSHFMIGKWYHLSQHYVNWRHIIIDSLEQIIIMGYLSNHNENAMIAR